MKKHLEKPTTLIELINKNNSKMSFICMKNIKKILRSIFSKNLLKRMICRKTGAIEEIKLDALWM